MSTATASRKEKILVLYGSQTGNSEQAAYDFCDQCPTELSPDRIRQYVSSPTNSNSNAVDTTTLDETNIQVQAVHMQLDDFLELEHAAWTRLIVIFVSSYGVGCAPLGAYRFRELCDAWSEKAMTMTSMESSNTNATASTLPLHGLNYCLCGLGDSKYTTFFQNPTAIDAGLQAVGAHRVGSLGQADASGTNSSSGSGTGSNDNGNESVSQQDVIADWTTAIWPRIAQVLVQPPLSDERLKEMQQATIELCQTINPDYSDGASSATTTSNSLSESKGENRCDCGLLIMAALVASVAMMLPYFLTMTSTEAESI